MKLKRQRKFTRILSEKLSTYWNEEGTAARGARVFSNEGEDPGAGAFGPRFAAALSGD
jgi:hypothetical protein